MGSWRRLVVLVALAVATAGCRQILGLHDLAPNDAPPFMETDGPSCLDECIDNNATLSQCGADGNRTDVACMWGCSSDGGAHCGQLVPSGGGATPMDLDPDSTLGAVVINNAVIDGDAGTITTMGNMNPPGYTYAVGGNNIAVFRFASLLVQGPVQLRGSRAIALVSVGDITLDPSVNIDDRGSCNGATPGPGGFAGGAPGQNGVGLGGGMSGGASGAAAAGGGGGGNGTIGGGGGDGNQHLGGPGGVAISDQTIMVLFGGGGGAGGNGDSGNPGGGGGGALQLVANGTITIGGRINAGGCGGQHGGASSSGAGAGAGGVILVEARFVTLSSNAQLAVAGGGGGGAGGATGGSDGDDADFGYSSGGGADAAGDGGGGDGAAFGSVVPGNGGNGTFGGGGGGGIGRIRLNVLAGAPTIDPNAKLIPSITEDATTTTEGQITIK